MYLKAAIIWWPSTSAIRGYEPPSLLLCTNRGGGFRLAHLPRLSGYPIKRCSSLYDVTTNAFEVFTYGNRPGVFYRLDTMAIGSIDYDQSKDGYLEVLENLREEANQCNTIHAHCQTSQDRRSLFNAC